MIAQANGARLETMDAAGQGSFAQKAAPHPPQFATVPRDAEDLAAFLYTSGTTGRSKGAMLTQNNLLSNAEVLTRHWAFSDSDVLLHALPIFHTHGLFVATNIALLSGCKILFVPKFDQEAMIALMPQATCMMGVPTFYTRLLDDPRFDRALSQHMRLFISGSAPLLAETHKLFEQRSGHRILERYGMTETNMNAPRTRMRASAARAQSDSRCRALSWKSRTAPQARHWPKGTSVRSKSADRMCSKVIGTCPRKPRRSCAAMDFSSLGIWAWLMPMVMSILSDAIKI